MTQSIAFKPVLEDNATHLATKERILITIEFAPKINKDETEYTYEHPQFVFGDRVTIINTYPELEFTVCALELIESKTPSGRLLSQPHWKYKVTNRQESYWKDETALIRYQDKSFSSTCLTSPHFNNYNEPNGRDWCNQFNHPAKTYHIKTNDCVVSTRRVEDLTTKVIELDRDGYPMEEVEPTGYFSPNFTTSPDEPF